MGEWGGTEWIGNRFGSEPVHYIPLSLIFESYDYILKIKLKMVSWIISALPRIFFSCSCSFCVTCFLQYGCLLILFVLKNDLVEGLTGSSVYLGRLSAGFGGSGWAAGFYTWRAQMPERRRLCTRVPLFFLVCWIWYSICRNFFILGGEFINCVIIQTFS